MDFTQFQALGWGTAGAVFTIVATIAVFRRWKERDELKERRHELLEKYRKAVDDRDLDLAADIAMRLRDLEAKLK